MQVDLVKVPSWLRDSSDTDVVQSSGICHWLTSAPSLIRIERGSGTTEEEHLRSPLSRSKGASPLARCLTAPVLARRLPCFVSKRLRSSCTGNSPFDRCATVALSNVNRFRCNRSPSVLPLMWSKRRSLMFSTTSEGSVTPGSSDRAQRLRRPTQISLKELSGGDSALKSPGLGVALEVDNMNFLTKRTASGSLGIELLPSRRSGGCRSWTSMAPIRLRISGCRSCM
mmetsp:Transcript_17380/g.43266  ORF Transcript_17380/g.43266 Transcript_17380/m.43266 type:complete len:227 (-) Transcript_17380:535-1215(-)